MRLLAPSKTFVPAGVNGPPLQTTIVTVKTSYKYCYQAPC